uniref:Mitochondrial carrier protein n=1 Tax=Spongospora subterranea TaxID=70186 RepID=A0A0H5R6X1_9EUKA|eukprot:CRZ04044.1 hypothetical protein [Spongospora subterranea]
MAEDGIAPLPLYFNDSSRHFVAGSASGMIAKYIEYPADTIKVRMQTESGRFTSSFSCIKETYRQRGFLGFYQGISAPLVGAMFENAVGFGAYSYTSSLLGFPEPRYAPMSTVFISGAACGGIISFVQTPLELVKCRMQSGLTDVKYRGTLHCLVHTLKNEGITGVFRGQFSTLIREIPGSAMYFVIYELAVRAMCPQEKPRGVLFTTSHHGVLRL